MRKSGSQKDETYKLFYTKIQKFCDHFHTRIDIIMNIEEAKSLSLEYKYHSLQKKKTPSFSKSFLKHS